MDLQRREFFLLVAAALFRADEHPKHDMVVRSVRPEDLEMPFSGFSDYITPIEHFFVRTHVYVPSVSLSDWRLNVGGEVATPLTLTMEDLKKLPPFELISVVECAGQRAAILRAFRARTAMGERGRGQRPMAGRAAGRRPQASRRDGFHEGGSVLRCGCAAWHDAGFPTIDSSPESPRHQYAPRP
jgi:hypothetical protein